MVQVDVSLESGQISSSDSSSSSILQVAVLANGTFSGLSGFMVMLYAPQINAWLGTAGVVPDALLMSGGGLLGGYALFLYYIAMVSRIPVLPVKVAIWADIGWVVSSVLLLAFFPGAFSPLGFWLIAIIAVIVGIFAWLQYVGLRSYYYTEDNQATNKVQGSKLRAIAASWMSLKTWVKVWLFLLNFIYLAAFLFLEKGPVISWVLITYFLTGPFLLSIMIPERGLSRVLGLGHIVPWTPLVLYISARLFAPGVLGAEPLIVQSSYYLYLLSLLVMTVICLAFDYYDVYRWLRGERYIMGSEEERNFLNQKNTVHSQ